MAVVRLVPSSVACSASAGVVKACTAYNLSSNPTSGSLFRDDLGTSRNSGTFTIPNLTVVSGVGIWFQTSTRAGFFNIKLQKGGVDVAGATVSLAVNSTNFPAGYGFRTFTFGTPATGDGSTNYRLVAQCTTLTAFGGSAQNSSIYWMRDTTAANYSYLTVDNSDAATAITSGDTVVLDKGVVLTIDQNTTLAPITTDTPSIWLGDGASFSIPNPGAAITFDLGTGNIDYSSNAFTKIGTSATPISAGNNVTIKTAITGGSTSQLFRSHYVLINNSDTTHYNEWYGTTSTNPYATIGAASGGSNVSGQKKVTFSAAYPGTWTVGDSVQLLAKDQTGGDSANSGTYYTIGSLDSATQISLNVNLNADIKQNGILVNITECTRALGIKIQSTNKCTFSLANSTAGNEANDHLVLKGIYSINCTLATRELNNSGTVVDGFYVDHQANSPQAFTIYSSYTGGSSFSNLISFGRGAGSASDLLTIAGTSMTFSGMWLQATGTANSGNTSGVQCNSSTFTNCGAANQVALANYVSYNFTGYGNTVTNMYLVGAAARFVGNSYTVTNYNQQRSSGFGTAFQNSVGNVFNSCVFGVGSTNSGYDIDVNISGFSYSPQFTQAVFNGCTVGSKGIDTAQTAAMNNFSYLQFHNYNGTVGDHRTWKRLGTFTTPSPYTSLVQQVNQSTSILSHQYSLLSQTVASRQHYLVATGQVAAAYYAGTHSVPKIDIYTDGNATTPNATLSLTDSVSTAQTLSQAFTPTTSNAQVVLDFQTKTDASGSNANCTWSSVKIVQRIYGQTFTSTDLGITETLTYPIATLATPASNPFITESTQATVHAYTMFSWNSGTSTLTVSANATVNQLYDWSQDYAATHPTEDVWFSTVDGVTYTLTGNLTINTGVTLTGTSSQRISMASYTLTLTGTGTTSGVIVTDVSGTHAPIALTGLVAGSTVYIYNSTASSTIYKAVVAGTSTTQFLTLSSDKSLLIKVRQAGYLPYETTGTVGVNGYSLVVSQLADSVYTANAIDGSTVTEFSFSGSTIKIYVNDPDALTSGQRMYNWYMYNLATTSYIDLQPNEITANSPYSYTLADAIKLYNQSATPLFITGANLNNVSGTGQVIDTAGGMININGYFPFNSAADVGTAVWNDSRALTIDSYVALQ